MGDLKKGGHFDKMYDAGSKMGYVKGGKAKASHNRGKQRSNSTPICGK